MLIIVIQFQQNVTSFFRKGSWRELRRRRQFLSCSRFLSESRRQRFPTPPAKQEECKNMLFSLSQWKVFFNQHNPNGGFVWNNIYTPAHRTVLSNEKKSLSRIIKATLIRLTKKKKVGIRASNKFNPIPSPNATKPSATPSPLREEQRSEAGVGSISE